MTITPSQADDAYLRLVFNAVAEDQAAWQPPHRPIEAWAKLYRLVVETKDGGLAVLQHIEQQRQEIERLQGEIDRLRGMVTKPPPFWNCKIVREEHGGTGPLTRRIR